MRCRYHHVVCYRIPRRKVTLYIWSLVIYTGTIALSSLHRHSVRLSLPPNTSPSRPWSLIHWSSFGLPSHNATTKTYWMVYHHIRRPPSYGPKSLTVVRRTPVEEMVVMARQARHEGAVTDDQHVMVIALFGHGHCHTTYHIAPLRRHRCHVSAPYGATPQPVISLSNAAAAAVTLF